MGRRAITFRQNDHHVSAYAKVAVSHTVQRRDLEPEYTRPAIDSAEPGDFTSQNGTASRAAPDEQHEQHTAEHTRPPADAGNTAARYRLRTRPRRCVSTIRNTKTLTRPPERPKKRSRTIGERVGDAVYNTVIVAGGIGVAAYRYWKGSNDGEEEQHASTSFSPDQRIPGSFNYKEADKDEDYVDIDIERPASGTSTPTRTPRKKVYKVHNRLRNVQSPKSKPKKQPKKDKGSNDRLDSMSAQLSAMIADGQKALSEPAQIDEEDLEDEVVPPSSSFTFTQSLPQSRSDYSIGEGLRAAASLYSK